MRGPWNVDEEEIPDEAGVTHRGHRRRILLIAFLFWGLVLGTGGVLYTVGTQVDGGFRVGDVTLEVPSLTVDLEGSTKRVALDVGPVFGVTVGAENATVRFVVAGNSIDVG